MMAKVDSTTRILIADDNFIFRIGISTLLRKYLDRVKIVAEVDSLKEIEDIVEQTQPDLILLDLSLLKDEKYANEFDLLRQICLGEEPPGVVIMMAECTVSSTIQALLNGALGVIVKSMEEDELKHIMYRIVQGKRALSSGVVDILVDYLLQREVPSSICSSTIREGLTSRETEILELIAQGLSNQEIAERFTLSLGTVKAHVSSILDKLQVNNRAQAALLAVGWFNKDQDNLKD